MYLPELILKCSTFRFQASLGPSVDTDHGIDSGGPPGPAGEAGCPHQGAGDGEHGAQVQAGQVPVHLQQR